VLAARRRVAGIVDTWVVVITIQRNAHANSVSTGIVNCALIPIVTLAHERCKHATGGLITAVIGTAVVVGAGHAENHAHPLVAMIPGRAFIVVVTGTLGIGMDTALAVVAGVGSALITIVTVERNTLTGTLGANVVHRTEGAVRTHQVVHGVDAAVLRITGVIGAGIPVVAIDIRHCACAVLADLLLRASTCVLTGRGVGNILATIGGIAEVVGTGIPIVAIDGLAHADTACALIAEGTGVAVVTRLRLGLV
jgi:hypothetical protein